MAANSTKPKQIQSHQVEDQFLGLSSLQNDEFSQLQHKFDEVIQELTAYGPTLAKIKAEYELIIKIVSDTKRVQSLIQLEEKQKMADTSTIRNFYQQKSDLEIRLVELKSENQRLKNEIETIRVRRTIRKQERKRQSSPYHLRCPMTSAERQSLHLTTEEAIDLKCLEKELDRVKHELEEIQYNTDKRHVSISHKVQLQQQLEEREKQRIKLEKENAYLCHLYLQLQNSIKLAQSYYSAIISQRSQTTMKLVDYILQSFPYISDDDVERALGNFAEENPDEEKEAEFILHCCEKFDKLFDNEEYTEAALIATTSPKGVLRTLQTMHKFKSVSQSDYSQTTPPIITYCNALMESASVYQPISPEEATECINSAVTHNQMNCIAKWISQETIPLSREIGNYLYESCECKNSCQCQCCMLAMVVFHKLKCYFEESLCLAKLGKYNMLLLLINKRAFNKNDIALLLARQPNTDLALTLVAPPTPFKPPLHILEAVLVLAQSDNTVTCQQLIKSYTTLNSTSWMDILNEEIQLNPNLVSGLIPILSQHSELDWMVHYLSVVTMVHNILLKAIERVNQDHMTLKSTSLTSSVYSDTRSQHTQSITPTQSRPKLTHSQRIDLDDADEIESQEPSRESYKSSGSGFQSGSSSNVSSEEEDSNSN